MRTVVYPGVYRVCIGRYTQGVHRVGIYQGVHLSYQGYTMVGIPLISGLYHGGYTSGCTMPVLGIPQGVLCPS